MVITDIPPVVVHPICTQPIVKNNFMALQYSVFQAYDRDLTPTLINYYANIVSGQDWRVQYSHLYEDKWLVKEKIMNQHHMTWHKEMYQDHSADLITLIMKFLSQGYYLTGNYNAFYIPEKPAYHCYNTNTVYLINGYNVNERFFCAVGKTKNSIFETYQIDFDDYLLSIFNRENDLFNLNFIKFNNDSEIKTNYSKIYNGIYDYLHSVNKEDGIIPEGNARNYRYGLNCYNDFLKSLTIQNEYRCYIEPTSYGVFCEHHALMQTRLNYLTLVGVISDERLAEEYQKNVLDVAERTYSNCLQYNIDFKPQLIKQIYSDISDIIKTEECLLQNVLLDIKKHVKEGI